MYPIRTLSNLALFIVTEEGKPPRFWMVMYYLVSLSTQQEEHFFIF